ncbi:MAG TPA: ParB/RepB/Spo0J family partition protein, partial [Salinisphaeraceae bacterium]|nr:ParB/RepB/Spo0J family partition protein [Salinisphaeraceae bacterium]
ELAASIATSGIIQPVVLRGQRTTGYVLLAGERRWRAAARAGLHELPAIIRNDLTAAEAAILGLIENLQRESLGVVDTALGLQSLYDNHDLTHAAIARRIGKSRAYVTNYLRILQLAEPVQALLERGRLTLGHAKVLVGLEHSAQIHLARIAAATDMSVRALEKRARNPAQDANATHRGHESALADLERRLSAHLGNTVRIEYNADRRRGQLRIDFHDLDEFDGLLAHLGFEHQA